MLQRIRQRLNDMRTLHRLCTRAEHHARARGQPQPGAEHFLLAAIELPDGSARRAFARVGADPDALPAAIEQQYRDALAQIGIGAEMPPAAPCAPQAGSTARNRPARASSRHWRMPAGASPAPCWVRTWWHWSRPRRRAWPRGHCAHCNWTPTR